MKHLTLIIAMVIGSYCWGQFPNYNITHLGSDTLYLRPKQDTAKVLMLVCDTSDKPGIMLVDKKTGMVSMAKGNEMWWQIGYVVKEKIETDEWVAKAESMIGEFVSYWVTKQYLDQNKKPLPPSIVVWMTKEIMK